MSIRWWIKAMLLALLLSSAAYFFGTVCKQMGAAYSMLFFPSRKLVTLLLQLLLAMGCMAVTAGIVAALLRPLWVACLAFAFSGLALLLGWEVTWQSTILTLLYILAAIVHAAMTQRELSKRIEFSVTAVTESQLILLVVLLIVAMGSFYLGYAGHIREEGFSIPEKYRNQLSENLANRITAPLPEIIREGVRTAVRQQVYYMLTDQFRQLVRPIERSIPIAAAVLLLLPLLAIVYLLGWLPIGALWVVFVLLRALGMVKVTTETIEVKRLVIG